MKTLSYPLARSWGSHCLHGRGCEHSASEAPSALVSNGTGSYGNEKAAMMTFHDGENHAQNAGGGSDEDEDLLEGRHGGRRQDAVRDYGSYGDQHRDHAADGVEDSCFRLEKTMNGQRLKSLVGTTAGRSWASLCQNILKMLQVPAILIHEATPRSDHDSKEAGN
ncbi:hypothetical protein BGZ50_009668 [Haplosporangium sp. Z 11]|nr:hypothetical protein BGZ50_009668 [Haplosporangium sp. Z 11]